jgi:hypothetical protein
VTLPLPLKGTIAKRGQEIFLDNSLGKCNLCHVNAGATAFVGGKDLGNANFNTGVENLPDQPARLTNETVPPDDGFGVPGDNTFNTPPLVEAASSGPFFHNNSIETIEGAVAFYDGESFNNSPAGRFLANLDPEGNSIELDGTQIVSIAAFLRVLNCIENIRQTIDLLRLSSNRVIHSETSPKDLLDRALSTINNGIKALVGAGLHPIAVSHLEESQRLVAEALKQSYETKLIQQAIDEAGLARNDLVESR